MIGLSVSLCVRDIAEGKVSINDVEKIIGGTNAQTPEDIDYLIESYKMIYWRSSKAEEICRKLFAEGKIEQPRTEGNPPPHIANGHWVKDLSELEFFSDGGLMKKIRYIHDCEQCVDLGTFEHYDLYFCEQNGSPTLLARYSDDGPDYLSGLVFGELHKDAYHPMGEAYRRVKKKGLLDGK